MTSAILRWLSTGLMDEEETTTRVSDKIAVLDDGTRLRTTPSDQPKVDEIVFIGDHIKTNYSVSYLEGSGKVVYVSKATCYGLLVYSIGYVELDAKPNKDGSYRDNDHRGINEVVAQDGRLLKLFEANEDEVFVVKRVARLLSFQIRLKEFSSEVVKPTKYIQQVTLF